MWAGAEYWEHFSWRVGAGSGGDLLRWRSKDLAATVLSLPTSSPWRDLHQLLVPLLVSISIKYPEFLVHWLLHDSRRLPCNLGLSL